ncbi:MAG: hypothetical protein HYU36_01070 [Planctomycetes bacterium]|nr:hypothetical protein [Planctomycetota bacterium]
MARANPPEPHLRIGVTGQQPVCSHQFVRVDFVCLRFGVNHDKLALVACFNMRAKVAFVDRIAASCEFLFAVAGL